MIGRAALGADPENEGRRGSTVERVEFGNGLRSHIARESEPALAETSFGPTPKPAPVVEPAPQSTSAEWVRDLLRERVGEQAERIWAVFDDALRATDADGRPDHALRLRAAWALLAEVYGPPAEAGAELPVAASDELAKLRRAKGLP
jgi:hypothetical protein